MQVTPDNSADTIKWTSHGKQVIDIKMQARAYFSTWTFVT
jgi:hypothetical protein